MLPLNPKKNQEAGGVSNPSASLCGFYLFSAPLSEHGGFISKRIGSFSNISWCQNILLCIVHDATSPLWEWLVRGGRSGSGIRAGAESLQGLSVQQTRPSLTHGLPSSCLREGTRRGTQSASAAGVVGGGGGVGELAVLVPASGRGAAHTCTHVALRAGHNTSEGSVSSIDPREFGSTQYCQRVFWLVVDK